MKILVGPEDKQRLQEIIAECAPKIDYRLVAELLPGQVQVCYPSPAILKGPRVIRGCRSLLYNLCVSRNILGTSDIDDVIYSTGETWGVPLGIVAKTLRVNNLTHIVYAHRIYSPLWQSFLRYFGVFLHIDGWITVTQKQANVLQRMLRSNADRIITVSQGVDTTFYCTEKANPTESGYILSVGAEMRNYSLFFKAIRPLNVTTIVQASSNWMRSTRNKVHSIPQNVILQTHRVSFSELRNLYAGASLVVIPLYDTLQAAGITTILEAMAMGKCVIATKSMGLPDVLKNGLTGVIAKSNPEDLSDAIKKLLSDEDKTRYLGENARRAVQETVSLECHAAQVAGFIQKIANVKAANGR